jgi:hypothetical protein
VGGGVRIKETGDTIQGARLKLHKTHRARVVLTVLKGFGLKMRILFPFPTIAYEPPRIS